jgi:hypothetical protein
MSATSTPFLAGDSHPTAAQLTPWLWNGGFQRTFGVSRLDVGFFPSRLCASLSRRLLAWKLLLLNFLTFQEHVSVLNRS